MIRGRAGARAAGTEATKRLRSAGIPYLMRMPEIARAMTRRWISDVPSKMV